jgi:transposase
MTMPSSPTKSGYFDDKNLEVLTWPPQSPDVSQIENVWAVIKMKISERTKEIFSKESLREVIEDVFFEDATVLKTIRNF